MGVPLNLLDNQATYDKEAHAQDALGSPSDTLKQPHCAAPETLAHTATEEKCGTVGST